MQNYSVTNKIPSFGSVIPIKKIVFDDNSSVNYSQMAFDSYDSGIKEDIDTSCKENLSKKVIQALNRILLKNDGAEKGSYKNALNNMIRGFVAQNDADYKIPSTSVDTGHNSIVRPCYCGDRNYILTGREARYYAESGENIGGARALVRDYEAPESMVYKSQKNFSYCKSDIVSDYNARLKNKYGGRMGLVIYAKKNEVPSKKGTKTEIDIKGIDFEPV